MSSRSRGFLVSLGLVAAAAAVFGQMRGHDFVSFDDGLYVYQNPMVRKGLSLDGLRWAFTTFYAANWHPLTWLSHMLDVSLFGLDAGSHHLVSLALHAGSAVLLFRLLWTGTGALGRSAAVAALFCLHPLHVESVAWIAERKDLLSTFFGMLSLLAYLEHARRPSAGRYLAALLAFALSLMAKPMLVTLPFVLLLLDWWPLERGRRIVEKIPFLLLSAMSAVVTFVAQRQGGAVDTLTASPLRLRLANALVAYLDYLVKTIWPSGLSYFYPLETESIGWRALASALVLAAISIVVIAQARSRRHLAVGWLWYLGTLVPVIGIIKVGSQAMADRYTYFPLIGIFVAVVWTIPQRTKAAAGAAAAICALAVVSWFQVRHWRGGVSLYQHALEVDPENWAALTNLGGELLVGGKPAAAAAALIEAVRIHPDNAMAHASLGLALEQEGKPAEAVDSMRRAIALQPSNAALYIDLCRLLKKAGRVNDSTEVCKEARH
jgi:tetratricopeptide (TPR) repeat protein